MVIETKNDPIEEILTTWKDRIGDDYLGYRGHVYRMFNFCLALHPCTDEEKTKLAIAACFHDIGLWSAHTVDYIPPSVSEVTRYLSETGRQKWTEEIGLMVEMPTRYAPTRLTVIRWWNSSEKGIWLISLLVSSSSAFLRHISVMSRKQSPIMDFTGFS